MTKGKCPYCGYDKAEDRKREQILELINTMSRDVLTIHEHFHALLRLPMDECKAEKKVEQ